VELLILRPAVFVVNSPLTPPLTPPIIGEDRTSRFQQALVASLDLGDEVLRQ
jgi:hypothetical protein